MEKYKTYSFFDRLLKAGFDLSICSCQEGQYILLLLSGQTISYPQGSNNRFAAIVDNESELTGDTSSILFPNDSMVFLFGTKDRCFDLINNCHAPKCSFYLSSHTSNELVFALGIKGLPPSTVRSSIDNCNSDNYICLQISQQLPGPSNS